MIKIMLNKNVDLEDYTFLEGFPGVGLVGAMSISYIIEKLEMQYIGYLESKEFPPLISIHETIPMPPVRIYISEKYKLISIFAEFSIPIELTYELADEIFQFIKDQKISKIISISGIPINKNANENELDENNVFFVASDKKLVKQIENSEIKPISEGISSGINALLLFKALSNNIDAINILIPIDPVVINPKYAESAIKTINKLLELNIDTQELTKEAKDASSKIQTIIKKGKETHKQLKKAIDEAEPSMYE